MGDVSLLHALYGDIEFREPGRWIEPGFLNFRQIAAALGVSHTAVQVNTKKGLFKPDFYSSRGVFFAEGRLEEIKLKWTSRQRKKVVRTKKPKPPSPAWVPEKGVITQFGMMLPRVRPDEKVLERLMASRPKRPSRDSSWRTRRRYNLKDLTP